MAHANATSPAAVAYAQALLELVGDNRQAEELVGELDAVRLLMRQDPLFRPFLLDPAISTEQRWTVVKSIFEGRCSQLMLNFMGVLNEKGRFGLLGEIATAFRQLLDARENRLRVEVTVALELDQQQLDDERQRVGTALGKIAIVEQKVDSSIIGGLVVRVNDQIMDASVRAQLDAIRKQLLASRVGI